MKECLKHEMDLYFSLSAAFEVTAQDCAHTCAAISQSALTSHSRVISHMAFMAQLIGSKNSGSRTDRAKISNQVLLGSSAPIEQLPLR